MADNLHRLFFRVSGLVAFCCVTLFAAGQEDDRWSGTWEMRYQPWPHIPPIEMRLQVAEPVNGMLYPTRLSLVHGGFKGQYELLLVKKNAHQLGIGRNKVPVEELPFGLGPWMMYLNGVLTHAHGDTGDELRLSRLWIDHFGVFMSGLYDNEFYTNTKVLLRNFLYQEPITLRRVNDLPWDDPNTSRIIMSDTIYYGVYDPIQTAAPMLSFAVQDEERYDHDTVTVVHNGRIVAYDMPVEQAMELDGLTLDTGENYIAFFADNYGSLPPNTANFIVGTEGNDAQLYTFDFSNRSNAYATVMVARFQYTPAEEENVADEVEDSDTPAVDEPPEKPQYTGKTAGRRDMRIGQWTVPSENIVLEIWDEQLEDGDIISVSVNGAPVIKQVKVTKAGQRFGIALKPGNNRVLFRAENLGRIPPNTAALRITAAGQGKTFQLSTDFERNNVLDIRVDNE